MYSIRPAGGDDAEAIARVHVASWQSAYGGIMSDEYLAALSVERNIGAWRETILNPRSSAHTLVMEFEGAIVGFAGVGPSRDPDAVASLSGEIYAIYVLEDHWGRGAGARLHRAAVDVLRNEGFETVTLWVLVDNHRARRFYQRMGLAADSLEKVEEIGGRQCRQVRYVGRVGSSSESASNSTTHLH